MYVSILKYIRYCFDQLRNYSRKATHIIYKKTSKKDVILIYYSYIHVGKSSYLNSITKAKKCR